MTKLVAISLLLAAAAGSEKPNVLFIAVDDLRPQLGCYGQTQMKTPNIDRLAAEAVLFQRAYCMVPTCGASRASMMTGIRPSQRRFVNFLTWAEKDAPGVTTMSTHFRNHGYYTVSNGKVFHHPEDNAQGWSEPAWRPRKVATYASPENVRLAAERAEKLGDRGRGPAWESADVDDETYADGKLAAKAIADLRRLKEGGRPFFMAIGFFKPHLPFVAPKRYWDLYDYEQIQLRETYRRPKDAPDAAIHAFGELRSYAGVPEKGPLSPETARRLIHGYYACVSYTDAMIGRILDELDRQKLTDNTIVVLWGDHGWNLGEHTLWCKHCCFETSMRIPLIVRAPGVQKGTQTAGLTESIDLYPTLCELAELPVPDHCEGRSFVRLLKDPTLAWKEAAVGRFQNGDTIRTDRYRFTQYTNPRGRKIARMLYDHQADPHEDVNISEHDRLAEVVESLGVQLEAIKGRDDRVLAPARQKSEQ